MSDKIKGIKLCGTVEEAKEELAGMQLLLPPPSPPSALPLMCLDSASGRQPFDPSDRLSGSGYSLFSVRPLSFLLLFICRVSQ